MKRQILTAFFVAASLQAATLTYSPTEQTGAQTVNLQVVFDDDSVADGVLGTVDVVPNATDPDTGDIRAVYLNLTGFDVTSSFLASITGSNITDRELNTNNLGGGSTVSPLGPFSLGLEFGTSGIGGDDLQSVSFVLPGVSLDNLGAVAVRVTSIGTGNSRGGSGKFLDVAGVPGGDDPTNPIPEPSTYALAGSALVLAAWVRRRR